MNTDQEQSRHQLDHVHSLPISPNHNECLEHDSLIENGEKQETPMKSYLSSQSFRDLGIHHGRGLDSSSDSDSNQDQSAFFRAAVHTTRKVDPVDPELNCSTSLPSASASSFASSVASSQEFQCVLNSSEKPTPGQSVVLESGIRLR